MAEPISFDFSEERARYTDRIGAITQLGFAAATHALGIKTAIRIIESERRSFLNIRQRAHDHQESIEADVSAAAADLDLTYSGRPYTVSGLIYGTTDRHKYPQPLPVENLPATVNCIRNINQFDANVYIDSLVMGCLLKHEGFKRRLFSRVVAEDALSGPDEKLVFHPRLKYGDFDPVATFDIADEKREAVGLLPIAEANSKGFNTRMVAVTFARLEAIKLTPVEA